ncbi:hypothetical protein DAPPUDRAFT_328607 [Daphnia pulex]|uniref:Uncharacterized protein n=1 Tax=Daphnia pulex TaxID=6669 RepID=E9HE72_DAPPU|nr:hypothetical protein DAPPUDRAFT_328607 [Daphnia pulex]|eukprot:EFX69964.1 hypothetical protein DAPPUDRAFT_328607 [Daphnia pulex]
MDSEAEFYYHIANWSLYMAKGVFGLAAVAVAKTIIWPNVAFYLPEKWDWPSRSKGNKKPGKNPHDEEEANH